MSFIDEVVSAICKEFPGATQGSSDAIVKGRRIIGFHAGNCGHVLCIEPRDPKCRIVHTSLSTSARREPLTVERALEAVKELVYKAVQENNRKQAKQLAQQEESEDRLAPLMTHLDITNDIVTFGRMPKEGPSYKQQLINAGLLTPKLRLTLLRHITEMFGDLMWHSFKSPPKKHVCFVDFIVSVVVASGDLIRARALDSN